MLFPRATKIALKITHPISRSPRELFSSSPTLHELKEGKGEPLTMIRDEKAEYLENAGHYHGAASRWLVVLNQCTNDIERKWVSHRRYICLKKAKYRRDKWCSVLGRFEKILSYQKS